MSHHQSDGPASPPKKPRPKKPPTGRPRGRPPKRDEFLVPSEVRRTLLEILDVEMEIRKATGLRKVTRFRAIMENLVANAAKGNPTSLNHLMRLMLPALEERVKAHPQVRIAEFLRDESDSPDPKRQVSYKAVRDQLNYAKKKY
jgi:hypothetical protein